MRLLFVGNFLSHSSGRCGISEELANRLSATGYSINLVSQKDSRLSRVIDMLATVLRQHQDFEIAAVEVFSGTAFLWAEAVCQILRHTGKPFILMLHGGGLPAFSDRHPHRVRALLDSARRVTTPSQFLYEAMLPYRPTLDLLPNGLDIANYPFRQRKQATPSIIWLRAFHEIYNPPLAIQVLHLLLPKFPATRLTMIGPDKKDGSLEKTQALAVELGVLDRVRFTGAVQKRDVPGWLQSGDIFLNTANIDNAPVSVLEAMACGLCTISTNVGGIPYLLTHEENALLVPPAQPRAMSEAVERILRQPQLSASLSAKARASAEAYDWNNILPKWQQLFTEVMDHAHSG